MKLTFLVLLNFLLGSSFDGIGFLEIILIYMLVLSFNPLFLILVFVAYLIWFGVSLIFLLGSYYYSYIIYLLFFSGLLVMFMYVCSIICNEKIYMEFNFFFFCMSIVSFSFWGGYDGMILLEGGSILFYEFFGLLKFFMFSFSLFSVFFVFYLLFCLVVVYEIIKKNKGPLRMKV